MALSRSGIRVMKFGGASLKDAAAIGRVRELVAEAARTDRLVVVVSAMAGVTDGLREAASLALVDSENVEQIVGTLHRRHLTALETLIPAASRSPAAAEVQVLFNNLEEILHGVHLVGECSPASRDLIVSFGERLSATLLSGSMSAHGLPSRAVDARPLILTRGGLGDTVVDQASTFDRLRRELAEDSGVPVVTGHIASNADGVTTTLGRNGSDYTATLVGAALGADRIELWTDVDGVFSADPSVLAEARVVETMTFEEAQELAYFGAEIVHPQSLQPAAESGIRVTVRNIFNPTHPGTTIDRHAEDGGRAVRAISAIDGVALVNLEGSGMIGALGVAGRLFSALAEAGVNIIMISQASSEHSICFVTRSGEVATAVAATEATFAQELEAGLIQRVERVDELSVLSIIGSSMRGTVGLSGRFFGALGTTGVNVLAISQGSSERNISVVISRADKPRALAAVHTAFDLGRKRADHGD
jgi:aspartokinase/homoserine dehydrogenase 1